MKPLNCAAARRRLHAYHDGELPVPQQIAVASHLEWCEKCAAEYEDIEAIGSVLRAVQPLRSPLPREDEAVFPSMVVSRLKAERNVSWPVRFKLMFEDAHLVYAGAASAFAAVVCVVVMLGMMRVANSTPRPDSLAALIDLLTPGSNQNPVVPRPNVLMPKPLGIPFAASLWTDGSEPNGDAALFIFAVVTREGRVENAEVLNTLGESVPGTPGTDEAKIVANLMDAVSRARFEPGSVAGLPVAVNMVWMVAHTTVRGTSQVTEPPAKPAPVPTTAKKRRISTVSDAVPVVKRNA